MYEKSNSIKKIPVNIVSSGKRQSHTEYTFSSYLVITDDSKLTKMYFDDASIISAKFSNFSKVFYF